MTIKRILVLILSIIILIIGCIGLFAFTYQAEVIEVNREYESSSFDIGEDNGYNSTYKSSVTILLKDKQYNIVVERQNKDKLPKVGDVLTITKYNNDTCKEHDLLSKIPSFALFLLGLLGCFATLQSDKEIKY